MARLSAELFERSQDRQVAFSRPKGPKKTAVSSDIAVPQKDFRMFLDFPYDLLLRHCYVWHTEEPKASENASTEKIGFVGYGECNEVQHC
jgi:hypothetical protein